MSEDEKRKAWERVEKGQKPDTEITKDWIPPKLEGELYKSDKDRLDQFKNAYVNALKDMNNQFGTDVKLLGMTNNGDGSYNLTTRGSSQDMAVYKSNSEAFNNLLNNQLQQKFDPQNPLSNQNTSGQKNITTNQDETSTYKSPTPLRTTPKNPTDIN
jgi:hypothetical protein